MRKTSFVLLAGLASFGSLPADAQTSRHHHVQRQEHHVGQRAVRAGPRRYQAPVVLPPGSPPVTHWNTPNADGNFGGPGAGGGGPSGA